MMLFPRTGHSHHSLVGEAQESEQEGINASSHKTNFQRRIDS